MSHVRSMLVVKDSCLLAGLNLNSLQSLLVQTAFRAIVRAVHDSLLVSGQKGLLEGFCVDQGRASVDLRSVKASSNRVDVTRANFEIYVRKVTLDSTVTKLASCA